MRYPCSSSSVTSFRACQDGEASWQPPSLLWSGSSGMALSRQCQWCMTCGVPWHSAHQLGVGCPSKGKGFPQEDPVAPHIRLGGKFLWRQERGRLKPGEGCAGSPLLSKGKTEDSDCPLPPLSSLGCEQPPSPIILPQFPLQACSGQRENFGRCRADCARGHCWGRDGSVGMRTSRGNPRGRDALERPPGQPLPSQCHSHCVSGPLVLSISQGAMWHLYPWG